jgi:Rod binding domain-containing protein
MNPTPDPALRRAAQDFEAAFLAQVYQGMFATVPQPRGALSGGPAEGMWRGMLAEEMARATARAGGVGLAATVMNQLETRR